MGIHNDDRTDARLGEMLSDGDQLVQRMVCEAMPVQRPIRAGSQAGQFLGQSRPPRGLGRSPGDATGRSGRVASRPCCGQTRSARFSAVPWHCSPCIPSPRSIDPVLKRASRCSKGYLSDQDFLDTIRLVEVAVSAGKVSGNSVPELRQQLAEEYPAQGNPHEPRVDSRSWPILEDPTTAERVVEQLESDAPNDGADAHRVVCPFSYRGLEQRRASSRCSNS